MLFKEFNSKQNFGCFGIRKGENCQILKKMLVQKCWPDLKLFCKDVPKGTLYEDCLIISDPFKKLAATAYYESDRSGERSRAIMALLYFVCHLTVQQVSLQSQKCGCLERLRWEQYIFSSPMHEVQGELLGSHFVQRPFVVRCASSTFTLVNTLQATFGIQSP